MVPPAGPPRPPQGQALHWARGAVGIPGGDLPPEANGELLLNTHSFPTEEKNVFSSFTAGHPCGGRPGMDMSFFKHK